MRRIKQIFFAFILVIIPSITLAQNITNSPYSRYGYGTLAENAYAAQRAMGGMGYGVRNSNFINTLNPASYSEVDSMTFMFEVGAMLRSTSMKEGDEKMRRNTGGLEYIAMQFPLSKTMGVGVGLEPVSHVGYTYGETEDLSTKDHSSLLYSGSGGLSSAYGAISYDFFDRFSVGTKFGYLFGDMIYGRTVGFSSSENYPISWVDTLRINGFTYNLGIQYHQPIGDKSQLVVGAVYTPKTKVNGLLKSRVVRGSYESEYSVSRDSVFEMPESYGLGITYSKINKFIVGIDASYQKWSEAKFYDRTDQFYDLLKINLGGEFIPENISRNYLKQIRYRAGAYYSDSYLKVKDAGYKEYGFSLGFGLPTIDKRSIVNLSFEYGLLRPEVNTLIDEQFFKLTLSYTFNELWFFRRKIQ